MGVVSEVADQFCRFGHGTQLLKEAERLDQHPVLCNLAICDAVYCDHANLYGDAVTQDMREAQGKIVGLALNGTGTARKAW
jgi:hypothetical protein